MADRVVKVVIAGDATKGVAAFRQYEAATRAAGRTTDVTSKKIADDLAKVEKAAQRAAAANSRVGAAGSASVSGAVGSGFRNLAEAGLQGTVNPLTTFRSAALAQFGGAEQILSRFSTRTIAAGAAVAGLTAGVTALGVVSVRSFTDMAGRVDAVQDVMGGTAEQASALVNFAEQFGVSSEALASAQAKLAVNIGKNADLLRSYGVGIAEADDGSVDLAGTLANVADAYERASGPVQRAQILQAAYGKAWVEMVDVVERGGAAIREAGEAARGGPILTEAELTNAREFKKETAELSQEWQQFTAGIGSALIPALTGALDVAGDLVGKLNEVVLFETSTVGQSVSPETRQAIEDYHNKARAARGEGAAIAGELDMLAGASSRAVAPIKSMSQALGDAQTGWRVYTEGDASGVMKGYTDALAALDEVQSSAAEGVSKSAGSYARAVEQAAEQIASAEQSVADAQRAVAEAADDYSKAQQEAAERVAQAEEDAAQRVVDAQERLMEVRARADRQVRDSAERLADARQAAADAMSAALRDNPYESERRREEALQGLQRAERDHAETVGDAQKSVADAERDTAEVQADAARSVADAQEQAADQVVAAQERVDDAQRNADRSARDLERTMRDAARAQDDAAASAVSLGPKVADVDDKMKGLVDATFAEVYQMRQLGASSEEAQPKIDAAKQKIYETGDALGWTRDQTQQYIWWLDAIPEQVNTQIVLSMNADQFLDAMRRAGQAFQDPGTKALFDSGILEPIGGYTAVPEFAGGGQFRAPAGRNAGLAVLHDREVVLTPEMAAGRGGTTVVVHGSVISERDLMDVIARAQRRGYRG